jgi:serine/threonine kinase 16
LNFEKSGKRIRLTKEILGEGGFSTVFKAVSLTSPKQYALKKVLIQNEEIERCVKLELEYLILFSHPNIIDILDSTNGKNEYSVNLVYILFPMMKKGTLRDAINKRLKNDPKRENYEMIKMISDFKAICSAFNYMHTFSPVKYVHQDIKPENILISDEDQPILTDFGSVREADVFIDTRNKALSIAEEAAQFCTISYRALELFDPETGSTLDSRTDVWGIGCLIFAWWFGHSPFECEFSIKDEIRVVECTYSRVLSKIPKPSQPSKNDLFILDFVDWVLNREICQRPWCADLMERLEKTDINTNTAFTNYSVV